MGIYDHKDPLIPTDTFGRPTTSTMVITFPGHFYDTNFPRVPPKAEPPLKGRGGFAKFHAKDIRKPNLR